MSFLKFQIRHPNGQIEHLNVDGERVMIGAGAHCEIRLPVDQSALEAVLVQQTAAGVYAKALSFEPPPTLNNTPFSQAPVHAESVLGVGEPLTRALDATVPGLRAFPGVSGPGVAFPSTQGA